MQANPYLRTIFAERECKIVFLETAEYQEEALHAVVIDLNEIGIVLRYSETDKHQTFWLVPWHRIKLIDVVAPKAEDRPRVPPRGPEHLR